jgi:hypothetical protein
MLLEIDGATLEDIQEALTLLDDVTVKVVEQKAKPTGPDPRLLKLPKSGSQRQGYLLTVLALGSCTREEAKTAMGLDGLSDCHTRVSELIQGGFLVETGEKRLTRSGDNAAVVTLTEKAKRELRLVPTRWFPGNVRPSGC